MIKSFKELIVWQKSIELVKGVYLTTAKLPANEIYGLSSQMRRASVSIPSNIAEGQQRKNFKEFAQFMRIAYASAAELETQLLIASDLYKQIDFSRAASLLEEVQKMLNAILKKLESR